MTHVVVAEIDAIQASAIERFWAKVEVTDGCWTWSGHIKQSGYGAFGVRNREVRVHRFAYELLVGPIPDGLVIDHLCRNKLCVRPDHLEAVTQRENAMRGMSPIAIAHRTNVCKRGHKLTPENVYVSARGCRACRACTRIRYIERRAAVATSEPSSRTESTVPILEPRQSTANAEQATPAVVRPRGSIYST